MDGCPFLCYIAGMRDVPALTVIVAGRAGHST